MRIGRGCERCRLRHIKCTIASGAPSCNECTRLSRTCRLDPPFRFKTVRHVYQKGQGTASRFELAWDARQPWVKLPQSLMFVQESAEDPDYSDLAPDLQDDTQTPLPENPSQQPENPLPEILHPSFSRFTNPHENMPRTTHYTGPAAPSTGSSPDERRTTSSMGVSPQANSGPSPLPSVSTWADISPSLSSLSPRQPASTMTSREAFLLRSFIQKISPWLDICDSQSHFSNEVPRRALQVPMVLKAVLALSSRHDAIMSGASDLEASEYHGQCVQLLILALAQPEETYDDNLLITVVILRIHEELETTTDEKCHWLGSNRLLNTMSRSASSGGLAEAASWQFLRQAIYASIVQYQPMQLNLENYERSSVFHRRDDSAYANNIIFLCARIIQLCSGAQVNPVSEGDWHYLSDSVQRWHRERPISWQPLKYKDANPVQNQPFPELWMVSPPAVVGLQYYHTSCIILATSNRHWGVVGDYELARLKRLEEQIIASHVIEVIGLSKSNETVENAYFMACHLLHRYGYCLRNPLEQQGSLEFLAHVEKTLGWRTSSMVRELEAQWSDLRGLDTWDRSL